MVLQSRRGYARRDFRYGGAFKAPAFDKSGVRAAPAAFARWPREEK